MRSLLTTDDGWPQGAETAALARRIAVIDWFRLPPVPAERSLRLATLVESHTRLVLNQKAPEDAMILGGDEGRRHLLERAGNPARLDTADLLRPLFERALETLLETGRGRGHPLLNAHVDLAFPRTAVLPVDRDLMSRRLSGSGDLRLGQELAGRLRDAALWELAALLLWEAVGDLLGQNPFVPLLGIYEEGLYPLDLAGDIPLLWAPMA